MLLISHAELLLPSSYQPLCRLLLNIHKVSKLQDIAARYQLCSGKNTTIGGHIYEIAEKLPLQHFEGNTTMSVVLTL
jgi:hypothetical protein